MLGCTQQALQLPSCKTEEKAETATESTTVYWIESLTSLKQSAGVGPHCVRQTAGKTGQKFLLLGGRGGYQLQGDLMSGWLIGYQRNQKLGQEAST